MSFDLDKFSSKELEALIKQANQRKAILSKRKPIAAVRKKIAALVEAEGYTIADLFGTDGDTAATPAKRGRPATKAATKGGAGIGGVAGGADGKPGGSSRKGRKLGKVPPKYRNPANPKEVWTGRGLAPRWLAALEAKGKRREDFLIKK